jgi:hypothetical protein
VHAVRSVAEELRGQTLAGLEFGRCLEMIVKMWLRRVAAVAASAQHFTRMHPLSSSDPDAAVLQVDQKGELSVAVVQDHISAERLLTIQLSRYIVRDTVGGVGDDPVPWSKH